MESKRTNFKLKKNFNTFFFKNLELGDISIFFDFKQHKYSSAFKISEFHILPKQHNELNKYLSFFQVIVFYRVFS